MSGPGGEGGGGVLLRVAGGGLRRPARTLPRLQLPHGVGLSSQRCEENKRIYRK